MQKATMSTAWAILVYYLSSVIVLSGGALVSASTTESMKGNERTLGAKIQFFRLVAEGNFLRQTLLHDISPAKMWPVKGKLDARALPLGPDHIARESNLQNHDHFRVSRRLLRDASPELRCGLRKDLSDTSADMQDLHPNDHDMESSTAGDYRGLSTPVVSLFTFEHREGSFVTNGPLMAANHGDNLPLIEKARRSVPAPRRVLRDISPPGLWPVTDSPPAPELEFGMLISRRRALSAAPDFRPMVNPDDASDVSDNQIQLKPLLCDPSRSTDVRTPSISENHNKFFLQARLRSSGSGSVVERE